MKLTPTKDRVAIKANDSSQKVVCGIIIPQASKDRSQLGVVVAVGEEQTGIKVGQSIIYPKHVGIEIELDGEKILILSAQDVLAIVE